MVVTRVLVKIRANPLEVQLPMQSIAIVDFSSAPLPGLRMSCMMQFQQCDIQYDEGVLVQPPGESMVIVQSSPMLQNAIEKAMVFPLIYCLA